MSIVKCFCAFTRVLSKAYARYPLSDISGPSVLSPTCSLFFRLHYFYEHSLYLHLQYSYLVPSAGKSHLNAIIRNVLLLYIFCSPACVSISKHKKDPTAKYCQLATAAVGGGASCRTLVFRGFWEDTGALKFITDRRSQKIPEIAVDPGESAGGGGVILSSSTLHFVFVQSKNSMKKYDERRDLLNPTNQRATKSKHVYRSRRIYFYLLVVCDPGSTMSPECWKCLRW